MTASEKLFDLSCSEAQESLSAMLDGETDIAGEASVRRHIESCQHCKNVEQELLQLQSLIADVPERVGDGAAAWTRAKAEIASLDLPATQSAQAAWAVPRRWAVAATVILGVTIGSWQLFAPQTADGAIIAETVRDFQVFQASGEVLDISATHPDAVHNWMMARVDFMLPGQLRAPDGVRISGARLCSLLGRKLAFIAYSVEGSDVGLYVAKAKGLDLPADGSVRTIQNDDGLNTIGWRSGELAYVVVSQLPLSSLSSFGAYFQQASRSSS